MSSNSKDMDKLVRDAIKRGWKRVRKGGKKRAHHLLEWKDGTQVTLSLTPSCGRAVKNSRADLRRAERGIDLYRPKHYSHDKLGEK